MRRRLKYYFKVDYLDPDGGKAWQPIAWCSFLVGKKEQARRYYAKILAGKPTALDYLNAGHVEFSLGHIRQAIDYYRRSIELDGGDTAKFLANFKQDVPDLVASGGMLVERYTHLARPADVWHYRYPLKVVG